MACRCPLSGRRRCHRHGRRPALTGTQRARWMRIVAAIAMRRCNRMPPSSCVALLAWPSRLRQQTMLAACKHAGGKHGFGRQSRSHPVHAGWRRHSSAILATPSTFQALLARIASVRGATMSRCRIPSLACMETLCRCVDAARTEKVGWKRHTHAVPSASSAHANAGLKHDMRLALRAMWLRWCDASPSERLIEDVRTCNQIKHLRCPSPSAPSSGALLSPSSRLRIHICILICNR
jgi:hypothetical protein